MSTRRRQKRNVEDTKAPRTQEEDGKPRFLVAVQSSTHGRVNLSGQNIGDGGVQEVVHFYTSHQFRNNFSTLKSLSLQWNNIWSDGARALCALLLNGDSTLHTLDLGHNSIGSNGVYHLARALQQNKSLKVLELNDNGIDDEGARYLLSCFEENTTLSTVGMSCNICSQSLIGAITYKARVNSERVTLENVLQESEVQERTRALTEELHALQTTNAGLSKRVISLQDKNTQLRKDVTRYQKIVKDNDAVEALQREENANVSLKEEITVLKKRVDVLVLASHEHNKEKEVWLSEMTSLLRSKREMEEEFQKYDRARLQEKDIDGLTALEDELESILKDVRSIKVKKLQKRNEELAESRKCKVCFDKTMDTLLFPCGHLLLCQGCSKKVENCPLCHIAIEKRMKVFEG